MSAVVPDQHSSSHTPHSRQRSLPASWTPVSPAVGCASLLSHHKTGWPVVACNQSRTHPRFLSLRRLTGRVPRRRLVDSHIWLLQVQNKVIAKIAEARNPLRHESPVRPNGPGYASTHFLMTRRGGTYVLSLTSQSPEESSTEPASRLCTGCTAGWSCGTEPRSWLRCVSSPALLLKETSSPTTPLGWQCPHQQPSVIHPSIHSPPTLARSLRNRLELWVDESVG